MGASILVLRYKGQTVESHKQPRTTDQTYPKHSMLPLFGIVFTTLDSLGAFVMARTASFLDMAKLGKKLALS